MSPEATCSKTKTQHVVLWNEVELIQGDPIANSVETVDVYES
jgi:hypothetical protein